MSEEKLHRLNGGPRHGTEFTLPEWRGKRIRFLTTEGGYYERLGAAGGGDPFAWYWMEGSPPMAVRCGEILVPVTRYRP